MSTRSKARVDSGGNAVSYAAILCALCFAAMAPAHAAADGLAREQRPVAGIERVVLRAVGDLYVTQGTQERLVVEAEKPLLGRISSTLNHGVLTFDITGGPFASRHPVRYHLTVTNLKSIDARGSGDINVGALRGDALDLKLAGSGNATLHDLDTKQLTVRILSSADVSLDGHAMRQTVSLDGAGDYDASKLRSEQADVSIGGSGSITVRVKARLTARISGSGEIRYYGSPKVDSAITGAGEVRRAGEAS